MKRLLILFAALSLGACNLDVPGPEGSNSGPSDPAKETFAASLKIDLSAMTKTEAGTYYRDAKVGTGAQITGANAIIIYTYVGALKDGSAFTTGTRATITYANLLGGLRDAMRGMKVGGERIFVIPSELGFGAGGVPSVGVPPNATLVFDIILDDLQ